MLYRPLGNSGLEASVIGLGTWVMGGGAGWGNDPDDEESVRTIHASIDAGINLIDTAPIYGFGRSEEVVGRAIKNHRRHVILATKCGLLWHEKKGSFFINYEGKQIYRSLRPDTIRTEVEDSLRRLQTSYIDLYQIHWPSVPNEKTPIEETMHCLMEIKKEGKIRAIGVSNVSLDELKEYNASGELSTNQPHYSILHRDIEKEILPWCIKNNIATLAYMPLEQGLLTGKIKADTKFKSGEWRNNSDWNPWFKIENRQKVLEMLNQWKDLTNDHSCTTAQLVLAFTLTQPGITHALCGARNVEQTMENVKGGKIALIKEEIKQMRSDIELLGSPI